MPRELQDSNKSQPQSQTIFEAQESEKSYTPIAPRVNKIIEATSNKASSGEQTGEVGGESSEKIREALQTEREYLRVQENLVRHEITLVVPNELSNFLEQIHQIRSVELNERAEILAGDLNATLNYLPNQINVLVDGKGSAKRHATVAIFLSIDGAISDVEDMGKSASIAADREQAAAVKGAMDRLLAPLRRTNRRIWRLVAGYTTPKEWTLKGGLKIPLLADVAVEIKFGPD
jgi:hypothetical protein